MKTLTNEKQKITERTYKYLREKLEEMKTIGRKLLADKLDHYRDYENVEENSAISEVLDEKESLEKEIVEIENAIETAEIVKENNGGHGKCKIVDIGCDVELDSKGRKMKVKVVSSISANSEKKHISSESPLGRSVMGKKVGDKITVETPVGKAQYVIKKIT